MTTSESSTTASSASTASIASSAPAPPEGEDVVARGRAALAEGDWSAARRWFAAELERGESAEALEGLSWAAWWLSDASTLFDARERAYRAYRAQGRTQDAGRMATWLGTDSVDFRGEIAVAQGWLARARSLLSALAPSPDLGWLYVHEAEKALYAGQADRARQLGVQAGELGRRFGIVDLEMMGAATEGLALVYRGESAEGIERLGEVAAVAWADEFTELWSAGWCYCYLLYACEQARDYDRAAQWCRKIEEWSQRRHTGFLNRTCRAHYAGVLIWRGTWDEAESELAESAAVLADLRPPLAVEAQVRMGELRRRQGRFDEAAEIFEGVADHPLAMLGLGELYLDVGDAPSARDRAEEYLRQAEADAPTPRIAGLDLLARAAVRLGDLAAATESAGELAAHAERTPNDAVRGCVAYVRGVVAAATGERDRARIAFEDAIRHYHRAHAPFEEASARIALAEELGRAGRRGDGLRHARSAARLWDGIGAVHAAKNAAVVVDELSRVRRHSALTRRESEVLRLVAAGQTSRMIATELVLSEHTVNRHISNILTKLGTASRSAAVAEGLRRGLL
ncbi:LuxR C-terminal-related transcriptional regulator [Phytoactinopolyspora halotolerans]|uniref:HTH luxR-type domain-containing protein n=1 Tax=Phytoactinopolyspora halotolerans TaxID=1981512 RepID=A0A6L9SEZ1_9ACTN|nr:LuxR family transcriptional regulator [Phytoactinopolyspora halotolerans]NEE03224.1 hypothetical protein [Phytoactinopolyspora halotolerans]